MLALSMAHRSSFRIMPRAASAVMAAFAASHARKQELRTLINAAQTAEDLDEIIISWPV